jgi:transposase InsO family protein
MLDDFVFPIRVILTDWGTEFFNDAFQEELMEPYIRFRPIKPRSPHLNVKVERSLLSDRDEFYSTVDINSENLAQKVYLWQQFYNQQRMHSSLGGKTPYERFLELEDKLPTQPEVSLEYLQNYEKILPSNALYLYQDRESLEKGVIKSLLYRMC